MTNRAAEHRTNWGGPWTVQKLDILERYLDAYTTALKTQPFKLMYIDAFAGTGSVELSGDNDVGNFVSGSAARAIKVRDKPFDRLIFVEKNPDRCAQLENLRAAHPNRDIRIQNSEANDFLCKLQKDWRHWRGVLFLDPFAAQVAWSAIETIAGFNALDTWILFPTQAVARMLPTSKKPDDIAAGWADRLTTVFGGESWRNLYRERAQGHLFEASGHERNPGVTGLLGIYKEKLTGLFGGRFLQQSRTLKNSRNSALFDFFFCVGHPKGIGPAQSIAKHILDKM